MESAPLQLPPGTLFGIEYYEFDSCTSTNDLVRDMGETGAAEGVVVSAQEQTNGRGRRGAAWFSSPNNLQFSLLLRPPTWVQDLPFINVLIAYALLKTFYQELRLPIMIKWPNDLLLHGRKICGVMSEMRSGSTMSEGKHFIIVGCGVNLNSRRDEFPVDLRSQASSILIETGQSIEPREFLEAFLPILSTLYRGYLASSNA